MPESALTAASKAWPTAGATRSSAQARATPTRTPFRSPGRAKAAYSGTGRSTVAWSDGSRPAITPRTSAASATVLVRGPAWSSDQLSGMMPCLDTRP